MEPNTQNIPVSCPAVRRPNDVAGVMMALAMSTAAGSRGPAMRPWGFPDNTEAHEKARREAKHKKRLKAIAKASRKRNRA